jgi:hypothetical protein
MVHDDVNHLPNPHTWMLWYPMEQNFCLFGPCGLSCAFNQPPCTDSAIAVRVLATIYELTSGGNLVDDLWRTPVSADSSACAESVLVDMWISWP